MTRDEFEKLVAEAFPNAIPEEFRPKIKNVAFLIESEPSPALRAEEELHPNETLLGHYRGIPHTARGDNYGMGATLPDTITLFQLPIEDEAGELLLAASPDTDIFLLKNSYSRHQALRNVGLNNQYEALVRQVICDTIWHEVAHHFGMDESAVRRREEELGKGV